MTGEVTVHFVSDYDVSCNECGHIGRGSVPGCPCLGCDICRCPASTARGGHSGRSGKADMAKALIGPTGYGTFGIVWRDFPALERCGGYSGPYSTQVEAVEGARTWTESYGVPLEIEFVENVNRLPAHHIGQEEKPQ